MREPTSIEQYLDQLADVLTVSPRRARRILIEVQDHLETARQSLVDDGMTVDEAEAAALQNFGPPALVARDFRRSMPLVSLPFLEAVVTPLVGLAAVGFIAIGLSGLLAIGLGSVAGKTFVAGDPPGVTYTPERCAEFLRLVPDATDCRSAALEHHFEEVYGYRLSAGILGLAGLAAYFALRRLRRPARMPVAFAPTLGVAAFGLVGIAFTGIAAAQTATAGDGGGANLSAGLVSLAFASVFALRLLPLLTPEAGE